MIKNKLLRTGLIIILLLGLGSAISMRYIFYRDFSFTVLAKPENKTFFTNYSPDPILKNGSRTGGFTASENYLALVAVRINTFGRNNDDRIRFRIKEAGNPGWYSQMEVGATFTNGDLYNFGFAPIANSSGKKYIFEMSSLSGRKGNTVALGTVEPVAVVKYKIPKSLLLKDKSMLLKLVANKITYTLPQAGTPFAVTVFFLPLLWFIVRLAVKTKYHLVFANSTIAAAVLYNILSAAELSSDILLFLAALFLITNSGNKKPLAYLFALVFLALALLIHLLMGETYANKALVWVFMFVLSALLAPLASAVHRELSGFYKKNLAS